MLLKTILRPAPEAPESDQSAKLIENIYAQRQIDERVPDADEHLTEHTGKEKLKIGAWVFSTANSGLRIVEYPRGVEAAELTSFDEALIKGSVGRFPCPVDQAQPSVWRFGQIEFNLVWRFHGHGDDAFRRLDLLVLRATHDPGREDFFKWLHGRNTYVPPTFKEHVGMQVTDELSLGPKLSV